MFNVVYFDRARQAKVLATGLTRESAVQIARSEARRRNVGRMFLAGSEQRRTHELIAIVEPGRRAA